MPEIAEVEIVRIGLAPIIGEKLEYIDVSEAILQAKSPDLETVADVTVTDVHRHGKLLGLELEDGRMLACHLRMTGALTFDEQTHERAVLHFAGGTQLHFSDPRKFGTLRLEDPKDFAKGLGPDLLDDEEKLPGIWSKAIRSRRALKAVLLDQTVVAGIGNYVVDEALWAVKLSPSTITADVSESDFLSALHSARDVALMALSRGGVSIRDYKHTDGSKGTMQDALKCYGRAGQSCLRCGTLLEKTKVAGRGTTYCPTCQA